MGNLVLLSTEFCRQLEELHYIKFLVINLLLTILE